MTLAKVPPSQADFGSNLASATTKTPHGYLTKYDENPAKDLLWNIPETKQGSINVIGGYIGSFRAIIKTAEFLEKKYPLKTVNVVLPDSLRGKVPDLPNFRFLKSAISGSFEDATELLDTYVSANFNLLMGDFSKNEITRQALEKSLEKTFPDTPKPNNNSAVSFSDNRDKNPNELQSVPEKPNTMFLLTRDTIDLLTAETATSWLGCENLILFASLTQLQKLLRAIYYPKMLLLSQSLVQVAEVLHKFTLSYPAQIITLANGIILIAKSGEVAVTGLEQTGYTPFSVWNGELAAKIAAMNLYNPHDFLNSTLAAMF